MPCRYIRECKTLETLETLALRARVPKPVSAVLYIPVYTSTAWYNLYVIRPQLYTRNTRKPRSTESLAPPTEYCKVKPFMLDPPKNEEHQRSQTHAYIKFHKSAPGIQTPRYFVLRTCTSVYPNSYNVV